MSFLAEMDEPTGTPAMDGTATAAPTATALVSGYDDATMHPTGVTFQVGADDRAGPVDVAMLAALGGNVDATVDEAINDDDNDNDNDNDITFTPRSLGSLDWGGAVPWMAKTVDEDAPATGKDAARFDMLALPVFQVHADFSQENRSQIPLTSTVVADASADKAKTAEVLTLACLLLSDFVSLCHKLLLIRT